MRLFLRPTGEGIALALCVTLAGCHHRIDPAQPSGQTQTPNIFVTAPAEAKLPPMQADPPPTLTDAKPATVAEEVKPKKKPKRQPSAAPAPAAPATPTPAVIAANTPPAAGTPVGTSPAGEDSTLGALAPGGDTNPKQQQEVADKISAVDKRISDLPTATADKEQKQIAKVKLFLKEASDALRSGDVEGAKILATKAELLLDDLQKSS